MTGEPLRLLVNETRAGFRDAAAPGTGAGRQVGVPADGGARLLARTAPPGPLRVVLGCAPMGPDVSRWCKTEAGAALVRRLGGGILEVVLDASVAGLWSLPGADEQSVTDVLSAVLAALSAVTPAVQPASLADLIGGWAARLDERRRTVLECRATGGRMIDLASRYRVSRQRIGQLDTEVAGALSARLAHPPAAPLVARLRASVRAACASLTLWEDLTRAVPELADPVPGTGLHLGHLAGLLVPGLHRDGPWAAWQPVPRLREETIRVATRLPPRQRAAGLAAHRRVLGLDEPHWRAWLGYCGLQIFRGQVIRRGAGVKNAILAGKAEAVLAAAGRPMRAAEIAALVPALLRPVEQCLRRDHRFRQIEPGVYALDGWARPARPGARDQEAQQAAADGGEAGPGAETPQQPR